MNISLDNQHMQRRMRQALGLARRVEGRCGSNPGVGCIIEDPAGVIIASGSTAENGRPHAETISLQRAGKLQSGCTLYSTLEPCCHHGKTPPCTDAIIGARIARVVIGYADPDRRVNGKGTSTLRRAGIEVNDAMTFTDVKTFYHGYTLNRRHERPAFTLKIALSADGRSRPPDTESRIVSGPVSHRYVHALRSRFDAIMTSAQTIRKDNSRLNSRLGLRNPYHSSAIILDRTLSLTHQHLADDNIAVFQERQHRVIFVCFDENRQDEWNWLVAEAKTLPHKSFSVVKGIPVPVSGNCLDLTILARRLAKLGLNNVLVEGGATLAAALLEARLLDRCISIYAPRFFGSTSHPGLGCLSGSHSWQFASVRQLGNDWMLESTPQSSCLLG